MIEHGLHKCYGGVCRYRLYLYPAEIFKTGTTVKCVGITIQKFAQDNGGLSKLPKYSDKDSVGDSFAL
jgi:hypothetical protein